MSTVTPASREVARGAQSSQDIPFFSPVALSLLRFFFPNIAETLLPTTNPAPASKRPAVISFSLSVTFQNEISSNTSLYAPG